MSLRVSNGVASASVYVRVGRGGGHSHAGYSTTTGLLIAGDTSPIVAFRSAKGSQ